MDHDQMDALVRMLATGGPRRRVLAVLAALLPAWALAALPDQALASCKKVDQNCDRNKDCCDHARCRRRKCRCRSGFKECHGKCRDLETDENHCGACDFTCSPGNTCCRGVCNGRLDQDEANCGACGHACPTGQECVRGACVLPAVGCPAGANSCAPGPIDACGAGTCRCFQSVEGATVCVDPFAPSAGCGQCNDSNDCAGLGADFICIRTIGGTCCSGASQNFCAQPCSGPR